VTPGLRQSAGRDIRRPPAEGGGAAGVDPGPGPVLPGRQGRGTPLLPRPRFWHLRGQSLEAWAAAAGVVLLTVATTGRELDFGYFGARLAVLLVLGALGLPILVTLAGRSRFRWPALCAIGFLSWALLSAALSPAPDVGFFGIYLWGTGWLFLAALACLWALGTVIGASGARLLGRALLGVALVQALVVLLETAGAGWPALGRVETHIPDLYFGSGQPYGTLENPVYVSALLLGGMALLAYRAERRGRLWWSCVVLLAAADFLVGERVGPVLLVGLVLWVGWQRGPRVAGRFAGGVVGGYGAGWLVELLAGTGRAVVSGQRLSTSAGLSARFYEWRAALEALGHHLLLGSGPSESRWLTTPLLPLSVGRNSDFTDTHNIVLEIAVTTGLIGLLAFAGWLGPTLVRARGPLALFALVVLATELVEPLDISVTPLALLALGAAVSSPPPTTSFGRGAAQGLLPDQGGAAARAGGRHPGRRALGIAGAGIALLFGISIVVGGAQFGVGRHTGSIAALESASGRLSMWAAPPQVLGLGLDQEAVRTDSRALAAQALRWTTVAEGRDPTDWASWDDLGFEQLQLGRVAAAEQDFHRAVVLDPWSSDAYRGEVLVAMARRDETQLVIAYSLMARTTDSARYEQAAACLVHQVAVGALFAQAQSRCLAGAGYSP
jgi:O-antigen ligase